MARKTAPTAAPALLPKDPNPLDDRLIGYRLLNCKQVTGLTNMSLRKRRQLEAAGKFPQPIRISQKIRLYPSRLVLAWIEEREKQASVA